MRFAPVANCFFLAVAFFGGTVAPAQEFRLETEIFIGEEEKPVSHNLTLFTNRTVYDFQMSNDADPQPTQIVIYDSRDRSFVLVDVARKQRMHLDQIQLVKMVEGVRQETSQNEKTKFLMDSFEEKLDIASGWMTLSSPKITYRFSGKQPKEISVLPLYVEFLDQFTRLNATDPTKLPPFPRMKLNQAIKKTGWIASEIEVSFVKNPLIRSDISLRSEHTFINQISKKDRERIELAKSHWMSAKAVSFSEFRGLVPDQEKN